ncbi:protein BONZAI 3-like [Carica papaya]|uniref:protein BONZAI 3-like n=1 Tax=Carica papaya TaxID=3649 RepID=UPI000B8CBF1E|nr:protein BONZAI 3-like [Carica papaya]
MGGCLSGDVRGGQQAIGVGGIHDKTACGNNAACNEAVDFFFRSRGQLPLFSQIELSLSASNLIDRDVTSKSDPITIMYLKKRDGIVEEIGRTEVILNNLNPCWIQKITVAFHFESLQTLLFRVYDVDTRYHNLPVKTLKLEDQEFLGEASCVLSEIVTRKNQTLTLDLLDKHGPCGSRNLGKLTVHAEETFASKSIVEIMFRCTNLDNKDLSLECSNGNPRNPDSLHYIDPSGSLNSYQQAIMEVGEVIEFYDSDKNFPAWGFGGRMIDGTVSHCFNLNGRSDSSEVVGVEGIMAAYSSALHSIGLAGPTLFGQVINKAAQIAAKSLSTNTHKYFVLLIITDGVLTDITETKNALVRASDLPLSILIVGVGDADFTQMELLDADNGCRLESSTGRVATRDIVQFVPMRDVNSGEISVVQALLEELPGQFLTYMRSRNIVPRDLLAT